MLYYYMPGHETEFPFSKTHTHLEKKKKKRNPVVFLACDVKKKKKKLNGVVKKKKKDQFKITHFRAKYRRSRTSCLGLFLLVPRQVPKDRKAREAL